MRALITNDIMLIKHAQCNTKEIIKHITRQTVGGGGGGKQGMRSKLKIKSFHKREGLACIDTSSGGT